MYRLILRPKAQRIPRWQRWCLWVAGITVSIGALGAALYHFDPGSILGMSVTGCIAGIISMLLWERPSAHHHAK